MPIWTQEIPHRRKQRTNAVPRGESFNLWELLEKHSEVRVTTSEGSLIKLTKTSGTALLPGRGIISGLDIAVEWAGMRRIFDGWCQQYGTIWRRVDLSRRGLYWKFGDIEQNTTRPLHLDWGFAQIRHVSPRA